MVTSTWEPRELPILRAIYEIEEADKDRNGQLPATTR